MSSSLESSVVFGFGLETGLPISLVVLLMSFFKDSLSTLAPSVPSFLNALFLSKAIVLDFIDLL